MTYDCIVVGGVFDASIMPDIISGDTNAPVMAVADHAVTIMMGDIEPHCSARPISLAAQRSAQSERKA